LIKEGVVFLAVLIYLGVRHGLRRGIINYGYTICTQVTKVRIFLIHIWVKPTANKGNGVLHLHRQIRKRALHHMGRLVRQQQQLRGAGFVPNRDGVAVRTHRPQSLHTVREHAKASGLFAVSNGKHDFLSKIKGPFQEQVNIHIESLVDVSVLLRGPLQALH